jgi:hypothetical protein
MDVVLNPLFIVRVELYFFKYFLYYCCFWHRLYEFQVVIERVPRFRSCTGIQDARYSSVKISVAKSGLATRPRIS